MASKDRHHFYKILDLGQSNLPSLIYRRPTSVGNYELSEKSFANSSFYVEVCEVGGGGGVGG